jgi:hypothetical protein
LRLGCERVAHDSEVSDLFDANPDMSRLILADHAVFAVGTDELY